MDLNLYFDPVSLEKPGNFLVGKEHFRNGIFIHTQNTPVGKFDYQAAIIGVPEERNTINKGCAKAPDEIRAKLYQLSRLPGNIKIADLGNLKPGNTINDAYYALRDVLLELFSRNILPVIIGGSQDITYGCYLAYKQLEKQINFVTVDPRIDIGAAKGEINSYTYLTRLLLEKKRTVQSYLNLGHQVYLVDVKDLKLIEKLNFESIRLGQIRSKINDVEPVIREANLLGIDISAVKQADAPGHAFPTPNGFSSDEICQISRYAGLSDSLGCFGIFETNPDHDRHFQTSHLAAQMIWLFLEAYSNRLNECPANNLKNIQKFIVNISQTERSIVFYKSLKSGRWWIELPVFYKNQEKTTIVACRYEDYLTACQDELPEKWLKAFQGNH